MAIVGVVVLVSSCGGARGSRPSGVVDSDPLHPSWAPNGTRIVFAEHYQLYVIDPAGGRARRITRDPTLKRDPVWSPAGNEIAYVASDLDTVSPIGGTYECGLIYVVRPNGTGRRRLSPRNADDCNPVWSPDGSKLAFVNSDDPRGGDRLEVMTRTGRRRRPIAYRDNGFAGYAWAPNSRELAFDDFDPSDEYVYDFRGRFTHDISLAFKRAHRSLAFAVLDPPAWSPDGRSLAFNVGVDASDPGLYVIAAGGTRWRRLQPQFTTGAAAAAPDWLRGRRMLVEGGKSGDSLYLLDLRRRTRTLVATCNTGTDRSLSPDETKIAYDCGQSLFVVGSNGRGDHRLLRTPLFADPYPN